MPDDVSDTMIMMMTFDLMTERMNFERIESILNEMKHKCTISKLDR